MLDYRRRPKPPKNATEQELNSNPHWRRYTKSYLARKSLVRDLWIYAGLLIAILPLPAQILGLSVLIFMSLSILDEADQPD
jgi:flagellar biosynthesis component FlhA